MEKPELAESLFLPGYDYILLNTSAGKDSQVMIDTVYELAVKTGVTDRLVAVHSDLGRIEWPGTKELAERQCRHYGIRFEIVRKPGGDLLEYIERRGKWPSNTARYCTSDFKRGPVRTLMTRLVNEWRTTSDGGTMYQTMEDARAGKIRPCRILNCMGLRADESPARAKRIPFRFDPGASNQTKRHVDEWLPIHSWTVEQIWDRIRQSAVPHHYAYDLGMPRLSCMFCIFAPRDALLIAGTQAPELLRDYVGVEQRTGHLFRQKQSLIEIQTAIEHGERPGSILTWARCA